jgi:hypothetical protein
MAMTENEMRSSIACGLRYRTVYPLGNAPIDEGDRPHSVGIFRLTGFPAPTALTILKFVQGAWNITKSFFFVQGGR